MADNTKKNPTPEHKVENPIEKLDELNAKVKKKQPAIIREFGEFINRGNVVDLAVGVIVGGAFSKIVTSLVNDIIMPLMGVVMGGINLSNLEVTIPNFIGSTDSVTITYGKFLQNVVDFLIVAFCIFIFVRSINKLSAKNKAKAEKEEAAKKAAKPEKTTEQETLEVLKDIRAELRAKKK